MNAWSNKSITIFDPLLGQKQVNYLEENGYAITEGDIIISKLSSIKQPSAVFRPKISGGRWPRGVVAFQIDENLPFANKLSVMQAIFHWQKNTHLTFIEVNNKNREDWPDYIKFVPAEGTTCSSFVGRQGGEQVINLSPRCTAMNTVHEIGHAVGFWHEQSRGDRNYYIKINWDNIDEDHRYNFDQQLNDGTDYEAYDYQSIMHYGPYAFSKNGEPTIVPLQDGVIIGQRERLSDRDIIATNAMYPEV